MCDEVEVIPCVRSLEMQLSSREHGTVGECTAPAEHQRPAISQVRPPQQRSSSRLASAQDSSEITPTSRLAPAHARSDGGRHDV